ncbi:hypothetical protein QTP70_002908 [Hemibagrus guttatus]|uniref:ribonuclease H n=1 Tax=Hemibagrus guttatus TaxID=175788 RepID=A0AAE0Q5P2_9TELE|nr:hypothetical protein QTP70_002908 [Hemibagrus guttatus]
MDTLFSVFPSDSTPLMVLGDFNLPSDKLHSSGLLALLNSFSLSFNSCPPTHKEGNVLDMTATPLHISNHHLVSFTITLPVLPKHNSQHLSLTRRNLHSISPSFVASCTLSSLPDHDSFSSLPLDSATDTLLSSLASTMDLLCPLSTIRRKNSSTAPWQSDVLRNNQRELQSAARKWKKSKLDTDLMSYRMLLSKFSLDVTSAKTSFYKEKLETSAQDPRKLHNIFSSLLNPPAPPSPSSLTAEDFATFYTEKIERICQTFTSRPTSSTSHSQHSTTPSLTQLSTVAAEEVLPIIQSCNPTTCPLDPIPSAMLQTISPDLLPFITTVINGSLTSGHVPTVFKKATVIPILKKPALDPSDISNYRPVPLLSFLSKILKRVVCNQLSDYLMQNNLHDPNQSGFKAAHSTETALLAVTEKLHAARSAKLSSVLILLDLSAAFDTVNHKTLLSTLRSLGICGTAWEWFASYLDGRSYQITWKGLTSAPHRLSTGVPQGSVLGPLLFSLYTYSLGKVISSHGFSYHCCADDTQLIFSFPPSDTMASARISACLADISSWMTAHQLKLNPSKTELLVIPGDPSPAQDLAISLNNSMISPTATARNLGVTLDNQLSFSSHVTNVTRSCQFLYNIRRIRPFLSTQATQVLVQSLVISRLDYFNSLLAGLPLNAIRPLKMIQNAAARLVFNLPKFSHTTPLLRSLHWLPVAARIRFKTLTLAYKAKNGPAPSYLKALVTPRTAPRSLRSTSTARLVPPSLRKKCSTNFIPDRSRPGLTTTAIGAVDLQGTGGNWATVGQRSRGGRRVRRQREKRKGKSVGLRIGTLNVGTMTGKGRELAHMMERRKVDILCVQETRWKGSKARSIGAGFKLFYYGVDSKRNGVGVVLKEELVRNVLEVKRVSDRVMSLKLEIEGVMLNVVSGYAPQVGCELEEKERFWSELDEVMESIPTGERVVIGADFNGHVGEGNTGDEEVMGKFGVKERNLEGQMVVDFAKRMDMGVVNTYFQKREEHRVTYKSGGRSTQVDYILCRRGNLKEISDCKVVVGESVARQHRMVVCRMTLMVCKKKRSEIEKKTKWWKLKKEQCCEEFRQKLRQALGGQVVLPDDWETTAEVIRETGRKVLGVSSGRRKEDKETWWWNEEVQDSIQRKRLAKKKWDMDRTEENRQEYKELQRRVKRKVSKAKQKAYDKLYTRLDTREGEKDLYRLARQRDRDGKDVQQVRVIKDRDGRVLTSEESVQRRWKEYFEELMNEENEREKRVEGVNSVEQKVDKIRKDEVRKALKRMKSGKAVGPDDIPVEVWKCLGEAAVEFLASLFNRVLESERMPEEWRRSVLVPIFKNKGDVQSCSNYRGIKLMSHTMKLWERVVEARLRKVVEICEQQYGFTPRKSTTDAIFALRILMEKYRDGQTELHCVFVDLEKVYDRVPREELWYCMRKSGVAEKYVRVVQEMYERSRTVVRCAVGQTEEFNVEVGLHQGSALSPFLFAIVMDQLSEEVRQESPWTMMFADDIVICSESREQVEENLERWRFALERRGMKVSRSKTEYMCVNEMEGSGTVRLQGEEVKKVQEFKYLGSTVQSNGECEKEVKKRVQAGWNGWRKVSGVLCDQKISARIKGKVYRTVVRPAMLYGLETVSLRKRQESELEVAELKMLGFSLGVTRLDRIRNEYIRGTAHVGRFGDKVREARLRWFGHVQRRESEYIGRRMLDKQEAKRKAKEEHEQADVHMFLIK